MKDPLESAAEEAGWDCVTTVWNLQPDGRWFCAQTGEWKDSMALQMSGEWHEVKGVDAAFSKPHCPTSEPPSA